MIPTTPRCIATRFISTDLEEARPEIFIENKRLNVDEDFISAKEYLFKICPFCGEYPEVELLEIEQYVLSHQCHVVQFESDYLTLDALQDLWNTREEEV